MKPETLPVTAIWPFCASATMPLAASVGLASIASASAAATCAALCPGPVGTETSTPSIVTLALPPCARPKIWSSVS